LAVGHKTPYNSPCRIIRAIWVADCCGWSHGRKDLRL
jgi:hypothetical protein